MVEHHHHQNQHSCDWHVATVVVVRGPPWIDTLILITGSGTTPLQTVISTTVESCACVQIQTALAILEERQQMRMVLVLDILYRIIGSGLDAKLYDILTILTQDLYVYQTDELKHDLNAADVRRIC